MTTLGDVWQAGIDAVIADNTLNRQGFVDAMQTVITSGLSNAEGNDFVDAVAAEYNRIGTINNPSYSSMRGDIISRGSVASRSFFDALTTIGQLPETLPVSHALELQGLREDRDAIDVDIVTMQGFKTGATKLVREALNLGIEQLREHKRSVREQIGNITGDPDS